MTDPARGPRVRARGPHGRVLLVALAFAAQTACSGPGGQQQTFASAEAGVDALVAAARADRTDEIVGILGPAGKALVYSGDAQADNAARDRFVAVYDKAHELRQDGEDRAVLVIGERRWPFPIPLVRRGGAWQFDTSAGRQEILDRRIGRDELNAITVCRALIDAERDYAERVRAGDGVVQYAQRLVSRPGQHDGLYWPAENGAPESPIGPLLARARAEGYGVEAGYGGREPYHGYFYRILLRQGPNAPGGARDYVVGDHMIGGFALLAFPASYGNSGIMTFIANQDGIVYQKNLGPGTLDAVRAMESFDPDATWTRVPD